MAYQPKEFRELVFTNAESDAKVDGDFLVFSSGARISLDQIKSVTFDISHSWRVKVGIYTGAIPLIFLLGMTSTAIKTFLGTSEKEHPPEVMFICLGIAVLLWSRQILASIGAY